MIGITLRQLRYFEALALTGHFGRAAESCSVSQPALSVQIKELEQAMGALLFERNARNVRLTAFGEHAVTRVRDILLAVDELGDLARARDERLTGRLRLGIIPTIAPYFLPQVIQTLKDQMPLLDPHVRETLTPRLLLDLSEGRLDAAILALPISEPSLEEFTLFDEAFVLVRPPSEADLPTPSPDTLRDQRLLLLEEGHCFRDQALSFCNLPARRPREVMDGSSLSTLVQMVSAGIGVTLVPEMALPIETRSADVAVARFPTPQPSRKVGMVWRKTSPIAPKLAEIAEIIRAASPQ